MIPIKLRKKIFFKLAQVSTTTAPAAPTAPASPAAPASPTTPDTSVAANEQMVNVNLGEPPDFNPTNLYPTLTKAFAPNALGVINRLSNYINDAIFYASNGQYSLKNFYNVNFNFSPTMIPSTNRNLNFLAMFAKEMYKELYNSNNAYTAPLNKELYSNKINALLQSQYLNNLSQVNPNSQLAKKMGGNVKIEVINILKLLLGVAPTK